MEQHHVQLLLGPCRHDPSSRRYCVSFESDLHRHSGSPEQLDRGFSGPIDRYKRRRVYVCRECDAPAGHSVLSLPEWHSHAPDFLRRSNQWGQPFQHVIRDNRLHERDRRISGYLLGDGIGGERPRTVEPRHVMHSGVARQRLPRCGPVHEAAPPESPLVSVRFSLGKAELIPAISPPIIPPPSLPADFHHARCLGAMRKGAGMAFRPRSAARHSWARRTDPAPWEPIDLGPAARLPPGRSPSP
jgi:hypothetical protein